MMEDFGDKMHCQFLEIIRTLLDANALSGGAQVHPCLLSISQYLKIRSGCISPHCLFLNPFIVKLRKKTFGVLSRSLTFQPDWLFLQALELAA